jgi:serine protease Do
VPPVRALSGCGAGPRTGPWQPRLSRAAPVTAVLGALLLTGLPALAQTAATRPPPSSLDQLNDGLEELARRVGPAVVQVLVTSYTPARAGASLLSKERSGGSGVILDPDGYLVTNAHVVEGARRVQVLLPRLEPGGSSSILKARSRRVGAQIVGIDAETDIAVLRVQERGLPALALGDSEALRQGQFVLAFGSPLGLENSLSLGVVSSVARQLETDNPMIYVQTDAPINPGNSGGPLVDVEGRVVGINTLILSGTPGGGLGFAAPSNIVRNVFEQIRKTGRVRRGEIGARTQTVTATLAIALGLARSDGVLVSDVVPGGGAAASGLEPGDLILSLDGKPLQNARQFNVNLYSRAPGGAVSLEVMRGARLLTLAVPVTERPGNPEGLKSLVSPEANLVPRVGLLALTLDDRLRPLLGPLRTRAGAVVAAVSPDGPFWQDPILAGDVIVSANRQAVTSVEGLRALLAPLRTGDALVLQVERKGQLLFLAVEIE